MSIITQTTSAIFATLTIGTAVLATGVMNASPAQAAKVLQCTTISVPVLVCPRGKDLSMPNHGCKGKMMNKRVCK